MNCTADVVFGWFVKELLYAKEEDGVLYLDTWQHRAVAVNDENKLLAKVVSGDCPCKQFTLEVVSSGVERVAELAQRADHVIVCAGNQPLINAREEYDRPDIRLPKAQTALLNAAAAANESTLLYLVTGYPFAINKEKDTAKARAVLHAPRPVPRPCCCRDRLRRKQSRRPHPDHVVSFCS